MKIILKSIYIFLGFLIVIGTPNPAHSFNIFDLFKSNANTKLVYGVKYYSENYDDGNNVELRQLFNFNLKVMGRFGVKPKKYRAERVHTTFHTYYSPILLKRQISGNYVLGIYNTNTKIIEWEDLSEEGIHLFEHLSYDFNTQAYINNYRGTPAKYPNRGGLDGIREVYKGANLRGGQRVIAKRSNEQPGTLLLFCHTSLYEIDGSGSDSCIVEFHKIDYKNLSLSLTESAGGGGVIEYRRSPWGSEAFQITKDEIDDKIDLDLKTNSQIRYIFQYKPLPIEVEL